MVKGLRSILPFLRNKFFLTGAAFVVWMLFFDRNDMLLQRDRRRELNALEESKRYYTRQIEEEQAFLNGLKSDPAAIERLAREKYGMKRENEDLFLIDEEPQK